MGKRITVLARKPRKSTLSKAAVAAVGAALLVAGAALPASAHELNGWAWSHDGTQTHIYTTFTDGSTYSTRISVEHTLEWNTLCDTQGHAWGTRSTGTSWGSYFGFSAGCNWVLGKAVTNPNIYFQGGSRVYGEFLHNGTWQPGVASIVA
ncbi:hypothetical protein ACI3KX_09870 [Microbacterium sp. ZW CA_36]|uniref:hypothetical protein n=1 Tax=Microbacterium sp. ZW CA_36 TaxID=3378078 RepID=UPI00385231BC